MANYFYPATGGMEELTFGIAKELAKKGHEVHVFTSDRKGGKVFSKDETVDGVQIHRSRSFLNYKYYLNFNPGIAFKHLGYKLDVLHVQSIGFIFQDLGVLLRRLFTKTKLVNTPHGPFMALEKYPWWQALLRFLYVTIEYPVNMLYHGSVQVNPSQYRWMEKYGFCKQGIKFIPNSIPESIFSDVNEKRFFNLKRKLVIGYIGRVQKYKGMRQIVEVLPFLVKVDPSIVFLVMGGEVDGEYAKLRSLAKELKVEKHLILAGRVSDSEKLAGLDATDIFVLPSEWEAFGIVLIEAMARGCALVSTRTEGGSFVVGADEGFLFDYRNLDELGKVMLRLINDKKLVDKMKEHNSVKAKEYLVSNVVTEFEKFYRS